MYFLTMTKSLFLTIFFIVVMAAVAQKSPQDFVDAHNRAREEVGVTPVAWNATVADYALRYAEKRSGRCELEHSGGPYGENLAEGYGEFSAVDGVGLWVGEKPSYDYASNSCVGGECLHYTQVVWRDSTQLGCARKQCRNGCSSSSAAIIRREITSANAPISE